MRRLVAVLAALALPIVAGPAPTAGALGVGVCAINGTIRFTPGAQTPGSGAWEITPAGIQCRGVFNADEKMPGRVGSFTGVGSYRVFPSGETGCLRGLGTGTVDYWLLTEKQDVHVKEPYEFLLAGSGTFTTPTLRGVFQVAVYEGDCLTAPATKAMFQAEVTLIRFSAAHYTP